MSEKETHLLPFEFVCSECGRKVIRDSFTYYASVPAPDESKKCPSCGHIPDTVFFYCSPECLLEGAKKHSDNLHQAMARRIQMER